MVTAVLFAVVVVLAIIAIAAGASIRILREYERARRLPPRPGRSRPRAPGSCC